MAKRKNYELRVIWIVSPPTTPYVYKELAFTVENLNHEWLWKQRM